MSVIQDKINEINQAILNEKEEVSIKIDQLTKRLQDLIDAQGNDQELIDELGEIKTGVQNIFVPEPVVEPVVEPPTEEPIV